VFTVATDDDASNYLTADDYAQFDAVCLVAPATLTGTITLATIDDPASDETNDANWRTVESPPGTDITIAAGKAVVLTALPFIAFRLESDGTEAGDRTFRVYGWRARAN
jgi:hypothetical protein